MLLCTNNNHIIIINCLPRFFSLSFSFSQCSIDNNDSITTTAYTMYYIHTTHLHQNHPTNQTLNEWMDHSWKKEYLYIWTLVQIQLWLFVCSIQHARPKRKFPAMDLFCFRYSRVSFSQCELPLSVIPFIVVIIIIPLNVLFCYSDLDQQWIKS